jgi:ribonucleotide reductase beta subunit family protein with ferritin-like domain
MPLSIFIEHESVRELIPVSLLGMNADLACQYIEFCAYRLLVTLKQPRMYQVANPVPWMTSISLYCKTNFFEKRFGEYAKAGVGVETQHECSIEADL